jgi:hypothetical protein
MDATHFLGIIYAGHKQEENYMLFDTMSSFTVLNYEDTTNVELPSNYAPKEEHSTAV